MTSLADRIEALQTGNTQANLTTWKFAKPDEYRAWESSARAFGNRDASEKDRDADLKRRGRKAAPDYTRSLDAAMMLVPEGYGYEVRSMDGLTRHIAGCFFDDSGEPDFWAQSATPALALTAACIRAQETTDAK